MDYTKIISSLRKFGSTEQDICGHGLGVTSEQINEDVIIAPWWKPSVLPKLGEAKLLTNVAKLGIAVWNIENADRVMTYIRTGLGAPQFLEGLLPLGLTKCKRVIFIGSVGSLDPNINIGDIVIPEYSVCGDGASRYIASEDLSHDVFGEKVYPNLSMFDDTVSETKRICNEYDVKWHIAKNFSSDTITAEFAHIDAILRMDCNVIEMETAVAFRTASLMNIAMTAIFSVSDNVITKKSLVSGRSNEEMEYREFTRRKIFPEIILSVFNKKRED
ncbi:MAG: phosphorylase [Oscillospiraceae bacterium]|nr:phosphorylase [Oscillospiraceae bacterium]